MILNYNNYKSDNALIPNWNDLFPPCLVKGDIHYSKKEYKKAFDDMYFNHKRKVFRQYKNQAFILTNC